MEKKNKKKSKINEYNILGINVQIVLTIIVCIFGLLSLIVSSKFLKFLYLFIGLDLLIMGYNNERIFRKEGLTIFYMISGIVLVIYSILKFIGVL
ncbi:MAG: hypothetical protein IKE63_06250 [Bacilli bacterium]|nr:hypothetical protein [Bacilli bacterium]